MKTVSSIVENYIKTKPFLLSALSKNIINLTSLSRNMMTELVSEFGKDVKQGAIVMALKRLSVDLDFRLNHKISKVMKNLGEITVRSSLIDYTFAVSSTILTKQADLISEINSNPDIFYTSSKGVSETNIIVSQSVGHLVDKHFATEKQIQKLEREIHRLDEDIETLKAQTFLQEVYEDYQKISQINTQIEESTQELKENHRIATAKQPKPKNMQSSKGFAKSMDIQK